MVSFPAFAENGQFGGGFNGGGFNGGGFNNGFGGNPYGGYGGFGGGFGAQGGGGFGGGGQSGYKSKAKEITQEIQKTHQQISEKSDEKIQQITEQTNELVQNSLESIQAITDSAEDTSEDLIAAITEIREQAFGDDEDEDEDEDKSDFTSQMAAAIQRSSELTAAILQQQAVASLGQQTQQAFQPDPGSNFEQRIGSTGANTSGDFLGSGLNAAVALIQNNSLSNSRGIASTTDRNVYNYPRGVFSDEQIPQ